LYLQKRFHRRHIASIFPEPSNTNSVENDNVEPEDMIPQKKWYQHQAFALDPIACNMASEGTKVFHSLILAEPCVRPELPQYELARTAVETVARALEGNPVDKIDHYLEGHVRITTFCVICVS
jgi:hypothetical protein